jgi:hypothetical protein
MGAITAAPPEKYHDVVDDTKAGGSWLWDALRSIRIGAPRWDSSQGAADTWHTGMKSDKFLWGAGYRGGDLEAEMARERSRGLATSTGAAPASVSVSGQAAVAQTFNIDVTLNPALQAKIDALMNFDFSVPLLGQADTGQLDTDAAPRRTGIGHM